jgi:hypothetical protein
MKIKIDLGVFIAFLALFCLVCVSVALPSNIKASSIQYNPWADLNNDGVINILDVVAVTGIYGAKGVSTTKAGVNYDSGWINITDKQGQVFTVTHNLDILDWNNDSIMVDITGKQTPTSPIQRLAMGSSGFSRTYGGTNDEGAWSVIQTSDSGYALAGRKYSVGGYDMWLVKTDAAGNMLWNRTYGGTSYGQAFSLVQTSDGGYALAGDVASSGAISSDMWLVRTDGVGNMLWNKTYGGTNDEEAYSLVRTDDGGYALAGYTNSFGAGSNDFYFVKTDEFGNMLWNRTYGGTSIDGANSVVQTGDGGYALAGYARSFGAGEYDMWLVRTDGVGNMLWNKTYGGIGSDAANSVVKTYDGGYALAGYSDSFGSATEVWLVKTNGSGNMEWGRTYGGSNYDEIANSVVQTKDGGYALAGSAASFGAGGTDMWLVKTDAAGNMLWNRTYGGTNDEKAFSLVQTSDGGYALAGWTYSFGAGNGDMWFVKTDEWGTPSWSGPVYVVLWGIDILMLYRGNTSTDWNYIRIRISIIK